MDRQTHIDSLVQHYEASRYRGKLPNPDIVFEGDNPGCGDTVTIYLNIGEGNVAQEIKFEGEGCIISQGAISILIEMVQGKTLAEIEALDYNALIEALGRDVVLTRVRCATLGLKTLKEAIHQHQPQR